MKAPAFPLSAARPRLRLTLTITAPNSNTRVRLPNPPIASNLALQNPQLHREIILGRAKIPNGAISLEKRVRAWGILTSILFVLLVIFRGSISQRCLQACTVTRDQEGTRTSARNDSPSKISNKHIDTYSLSPAIQISYRRPKRTNPSKSIMAAPKVIILMADYGHDPTETAIPWMHFDAAGFTVSFATETGKTPACDSRMLEGMTGMLLGAAQPAKTAYKTLSTTCAAFQAPLSWSDPTFALTDYDLVFLPGGHDKAVRQIIDSPRVGELLATFFPLTRVNSGQRKCLAAVCHGVQVLSAAKYPDTGKSVLHDVTTTSLTSFMEQSVYQATRLFLGDYYKTYGAGTPSVEEYVRRELDNPDEQFESSMSFAPFVVGDERYNYISARFPGDVEEFSKAVVERVKKVMIS